MNKVMESLCKVSDTADGIIITCVFGLFLVIAPIAAVLAFLGLICFGIMQLF